MSKANTFRPGWYRIAGMREMVAAYYQEIRKASRCHESAVMACCRECGILFLTPIGNSGRSDMRCPTGCRKKHEVDSSKNRSRAYAQTLEGKEKKKTLNRKRSLVCESAKRKDPELSRRIEPLPNHLRYYRWLIYLLDGVLMSSSDMKRYYEVILAKVRQRGLPKPVDPRKLPDD